MEKEEILERIKKAREKNAVFEAENVEKEEIKELERKAIFEENKARDLPFIKKAEEEHGEIKYVNTRLGAIVVKKPHHLTFQQFSKKLASDKGPDNMDMWRFIRKSIVYPDISKVEEITEEYPGTTILLCNAVIELGNGNVEEIEGK